MLGAIARFKIQDGKGPQFEAAFKALAEKVRANEPGNHLYQLCKSRADASDYLVMEIYTDDAALDVHRNSAHIKELGAALGPFMQGRPSIEMLDTVD
jgi:quinol monooxygenase YgiN